MTIPIQIHPRQIRLDLLSGSGLFQSGSKLNIDLADNSGLSLISNELSLGFPQALDVGSIGDISGSSHSHSIISSSNPGAGSSILATDSSGQIILTGAQFDNVGIGTNVQTLYRLRINEIALDATNSNKNKTVLIQDNIRQQTASNFSTTPLSVTHLFGINSGSSFNTTEQYSIDATFRINSHSGSLVDVGVLKLRKNFLVNYGGSIVNYYGLLVDMSDFGAGSGSTTSENNYGIRIKNPSLSVHHTKNNYGIYIDEQSVGSLLNYSIYTNEGKVRFGDNLNIISSGCQLTLSGVDDTNDYVNFLVDGDGYLNLASSGNQIRLNSATRLQSDTYTSQISGWSITHSGAGDFRYLYADEMHVKSFIADLEQALAGGQIIAKSVAVLYQDFNLPTAGNSGSLYVQDLPGASGMQVFQTNDIVGLRQFDRSGGSLTVAWGWGTVTNPSTAGSDLGYQTWTFTRESGSPGYGSGTIQADSLVLDFGTSGNGYYEVNAIDGIYAENSPYSQIVTWDTSPSNRTVRVRTGNLKGITATSNEYGMFAGSGSLVSNQYLRISNTNFDIHNLDLVIHDGTVERIRLDHEDGMYLSDENYKAVLGVYSGSTSKPWGGLTLETGDLLIGNLDSGAGIYWDKSLSRISVGGSDINIKMSGSSINFMNQNIQVASLTGSIWNLGVETAEHVTIDTSGVSLYDNATLYGRFASTTTIGSTSTEHVSITSSTMQFKDGATVYTQLTGGTLTLGRVGAGLSNTLISGGELSIRNNLTERITLTSAGILTINNSSGNAVFTFNSSAGAEFTLPLTLGTGGGIYQGSGTFASPTTGLKIYNVSGSGRIVGYNSGASQISFDTDGKFYAGGGTVAIDSMGIRASGSGRISVQRYTGNTYPRIQLDWIEGTNTAWIAYYNAASTIGSYLQFNYQDIYYTAVASGYHHFENGIIADSTIHSAGGLELGADVFFPTSVGNGDIITTGTITESNSYGCVVYRSGSVNIATGGSGTIIGMSSEYRDQHGWHSSNSPRIIVPSAGIYLITASLAFNANSTGIRTAGILANRTTVVTTVNDYAPSASLASGLNPSGTVYLTAGQYVEVIGYQTSGGNLGINVYHFAATRIA